MADVLEVIEVATTQLSGEQYPTMSLVLPLVFGLRTQLAANEEASDPEVVSSFKESFCTQLTQRFSLDHLVPSSLPILCSALDPRLRSLSFLTLTEREEVKHILIEMVEDQNVPSAAPTSAQESSASTEPPRKKSRKDVILAQLYGHSEEDLGAESGNDAAVEVAMYLREKPARMDVSPLSWWKANADRFPALASLAHKYLSIPATSTPSERVFSTSGIVVDKLRAALTAENVDTLTFLHKNAKSLGLEQDVVPLSTAPRMKMEENVEKREKVMAPEMEEEEEQGRPIVKKCIGPQASQSCFRKSYQLFSY